MDTVPVSLVLDRLGHLELRYKHAGAMSEAGGIRLAIVEILRLAQEPKPETEVSPLLPHL